MIDLSQRRQSLLICLALALATAAVYWPVRHFGFVNYDDPDYVANNARVQEGITREGVVWAFTTTDAYNWHPLTWLSHMLDCQLFGLNAGAHKLVNVVFHIASALLLFSVPDQMTGAPWRSAFVAALFALHPLHVESVAWVAERKDVLSAFFWMLTMGAYVRYVQAPKAGKYLLALTFFALGLMAKPMLVTLPCALLLLDFWPLGRTPWAQAAIGRRTPTEIKRLVWEKLPFLGLSIAASVITYRAQATGAFVSAIKSLPLALRVSNAAVSYVRYIAKVVWPVNLAVFYPHPGSWKLAEVVLAAAAVVFLTILLLRVARENPYLTVGWLWFLGTLLPVVGLIQVGDQSMADRFTYLPSIGLFIMVSWGVPELVFRWREAEAAMQVAALSVIVGLVVGTRHQLQFWGSNIALFERAIAVTRDNYIAQNNLGVALREKGDLEQAAIHFHEAVSIWPQFPEANRNLADVLLRAGRLDEAIHYYRQALQRRPGWAETHNALGLALAQQGKLQEAAEHFTRAVDLDPSGEVARSNLALALMKLGRLDDAVAHATRALELNPKDAQAQYLMGLLLTKQGRQAEAVVHFDEAIRLRPAYAETLRQGEKPGQ